MEHVESDQVTVSCVVIFLNGAEFLDDAVRSVLGQQDVEDWELLLVDDGSTDGSTEMAKDWPSRDRRIRYLMHADHENRGMSASRNLGLAHARGEFVTFLDCDDLFLPHAFRHMTSSLLRHATADVVFAQAWLWTSWGGRAPAGEEDWTYPPGKSLRTGVVHDPPAVFNEVFGVFPVEGPQIASVLFRTDAIRGIGGFEDRFRGLYEDQVIVAKAGLALKVLLDPRPVALYRRHLASSTITSDNEHEQTARADFFEWLYRYIDAMSPAFPIPDDLESVGAAKPDVSLSHRVRTLLTAAWQRVAPDRAQTWLRRRRGTGGLRNPAVRKLLGPIGAPIDADVITYWTGQFVNWNSRRLRGRLAVADDPMSPQALDLAAVNSLLHGATTVDRLSVMSDVGAKRYDGVIVTASSGTAASPEALVAWSQHLVGSDGDVLIMLPGEAHPICEKQNRIDRFRLAGLLSESYPGHEVGTENLGSPVTLAAIRDGRGAMSLTGVELERHDTRVPVCVVGWAIRARR